MAMRMKTRVRWISWKPSVSRAVTSELALPRDEAPPSVGPVAEPTLSTWVGASSSYCRGAPDALRC